MKAPTPREQLERFGLMARRALAFWKRSLLLFVVGAAISVPYVFTRPRTWRSETVILYQETIRSSDVVGGEGGSEGARRVGARLRELLLSRASLEPIIKDMDLYAGSIVKGQLVGAVEEMRKNITFRAQEGDTYVISFQGDTPQQVQEVTKRLGDCIIGEADRRRAEKAKTLKEFLTAESVRNDTELKLKEGELAKFVVLHPEFAPRLQGLPPPTAVAGGATATGPSDPLLAAMVARAARIERQLAAKANPGLPPKPAPTFQPPPDSAELVAARRNLSDKLALYTEKHPDVIAARARLKAAEDAQAATNADALAAWKAQQVDDAPPPASEKDEAQLKRDLANLQALIAARRATLAGVPLPDAGAASEATTASGPVEFELEFRRLQREVSDARERQAHLEERLFNASLTESSVMDDRNIQVSVLDPAYLPVRASSKPRSLLLAGLLAACLLLAFGVAVGSALLDDHIYDRKDIERLDLLPLLAVIPKPATGRIHQLPPKRG